MSPLSWPVILGTLLVGSPALWAAQVSGTLSADVALVRLAVCLVVVWAGCAVVATLAERTVEANELEAAAEAEALAALERAKAEALAALEAEGATEAA
jgi:hypothetical protein